MATTTAPAGAEPEPAVGPTPGARRRSRWARARVVALLAASLGCAACGLVYELSLLNLAAILVGSSVQTTSLVLGVFVCAMGVGSVLSKPLAARPLAAFVGVEGALALVGGLSGPALYGAFAWFEAYEPVALGAATVIGALIGAEIPLLMALIGRLRSASSSEDAADVMAADYVGALVAGVAFPFALVPLFGLVSTTLAAGLLNLVLAAGVVLVMRPPARRAAAGLAALAVLAVALGAGLARSGGWVASVRQRLYDDPIVATAGSRLQEIVLTRSFDGRDLRLFLDGDLQFSSVDEYRYHEALVHPAMAGPRRRVLILGGGDGMAAREVLRYDDVAEVVQVELDPAVTRLATEDPGVAALNDRSLADERVTVVHDDAFTWVADRARARREGDGAEPFDVVIVDVPDPESLDVVRLYSEEMYRAVAAVLAPDGRMVVQAGSPYFARQAFWSVEATVAAAGLRATPYHVDVPTFGDWGFVVGAPGDYALGLEGGVATRFLTPEVVAASQAFGADAGPVAVEVNTLDDPVLVGYTERGWSAY